MVNINNFNHKSILFFYVNVYLFGGSFCLCNGTFQICQVISLISSFYLYVCIIYLYYIVYLNCTPLYLCVSGLNVIFSIFFHCFCDNLYFVILSFICRNGEKFILFISITNIYPLTNYIFTVLYYIFLYFSHL